MLRALDVCSAGGGMSRGLHRAGFSVLGVDRRFVKDYPYPMLVADARQVLADHAFLNLFDVVHVSAPCQPHTRAQHLRKAQGREVRAEATDLSIEAVREALIAWGGPYVLENVPESPVRPDLILCGSSFGLGVRRHRWFESNMPLGLSPECRHHEQGRPVGVYGSLDDAIPSGGNTARTLAEAGDAMGIDWLTRWADMKEAVPPAFGEYVGDALRNALTRRIAV